MTLSLLNPGLLLGTLLILVPVLAHLFAMARPRPMPFPSLQWLRAVERTTTRLRKPKDWLLLLLRTLAVAALAAAFLQPLLFRGTQLTAANSLKTVVVVIDRSASMAFVEQGQSRFSRAIGRAEEILRGAGPRTLGNVIWIDGQPGAEFPEPAINLDALRDAIRRAEVVMEAGDVSEALRLGSEQIGRGEGAKELYVISDFQASAWKQVDLIKAPNVALFTVPVASTEASNVALAQVLVQPERPVQGADVRILARVRNFGSGEAKTTVQLAFGELRRSQAVAVGPWGEGVVEFRVPCGRAGLQSLSVALPEDAFPADDRRYATVEIRESRRVVTMGTEGDPSLVLWRRALGSLGWLDVTNQGGAPEVIVAVRAKADLAGSLRSAAEAGATVICQPGTDWSGAAWITWWGADEAQSVLLEEKRDRVNDPPWTLQTAHEDHALWQLFRNGEYGDPAGGGIWKRLQVASTREATLLRYSDGVAAIAAKRVGRGWLVLWNLELDEAFSDRVQQPSFLVLMGELLLTHGEAGGVIASRLFFPGEAVYWQPDQALAADQVRLENDAGLAQPVIHEEEVSPPIFRARDALAPGNYRWLLDSQLAERASVNFPSDAESDLRVIDPATLASGSTLTLQAAARLAAQRDGEPMWPWCIGVASLFLLLESWIARSTIRASRASGASPNLAVR